MAPRLRGHWSRRRTTHTRESVAMGRERSIAMPTVIAVVAHAALFVATGLLIQYGSHPDLGLATWSYRLYYDYASRAMAGHVPYRDFLVEYPILTFPVFLVPRLFVSDFASYCVAFGAEMWLFDAAAIV